MRHAALMMLISSSHEKKMHNDEYAGHHEKHDKHLSKDEAHEWVRSMEHEDGLKGQHWSYEQTTQVLKNKGYDINCAEWYAIMNAMHADYCEVAKMFGVDNIDFYAAMAKAWLCDEDAVEDKARQYWEHVAKR